ncbi:MAG: peptidylprolyl isomerase [Candidatus Marinimicrobia bacterium]|nr:peptidylprolyl isomerase [Candidatus Neomarinimicrobiota bacterium]
MNKNKLLTISVAFAFSFLASQEIADKQFIDGVAAVVEDNIILKSDLVQLVNMTALQSKINPQTHPREFESLQENVIAQMVDQKIILEMAALDSIEAEEKEINTALDQQISNIIAQAGGEAKAEEMLGQTLKSFRREFWYDMRDRLVSEKYQQQLLNNISVTRNGVFDFYTLFKDSLPTVPTTVKMRHLLIKPSPNKASKDAAYDTLDSLRSIILTGGNFEDLARQYSMDPGSKIKGGHLGFVNRGSFVKPFEAVAFSQDINEISFPVETDFGYHLIETLEKKGDKIKVRHILIQPQLTPDDEKLAYGFALSLKDSSKTFDEYKSFVKKYSADERTSEVGGDLGWIDPLNYPIPEIGQAVKYINIEECSPPINSSMGFHLLWVEKIKPGGKPTLETHWSEIEGMALNYKKMQWYDNWITDARKNFYISINEK